jgi:hypothetical protein
MNKFQHDDDANGSAPWRWGLLIALIFAMTALVLIFG